jgi:hypothetical protein
VISYDFFYLVYFRILKKNAEKIEIDVRISRVWRAGPGETWARAMSDLPDPHPSRRGMLGATGQCEGTPKIYGQAVSFSEKHVFLNALYMI